MAKSKFKFRKSLIKRVESVKCELKFIVVEFDELKREPDDEIGRAD